MIVQTQLLASAALPKGEPPHIEVGIIHPIDANDIATQLRKATNDGETRVSVTFHEGGMYGDRDLTHTVSPEVAKRLGIILMTVPCVSLWRTIRFQGLNRDDHGLVILEMRPQRKDVTLTLLEPLSHPPP